MCPNLSDLDRTLDVCRTRCLKSVLEKCATDRPVLKLLHTQVPTDKNILYKLFPKKYVLSLIASLYFLPLDVVFVSKFPPLSRPLFFYYFPSSAFSFASLQAKSMCSCRRRKLLTLLFQKKYLRGKENAKKLKLIHSTLCSLEYLLSCIEKFAKRVRVFIKRFLSVADRLVWSALVSQLSYLSKV